ncbi:MAG TPA: CopD family protein [Arenimonas sp.]|nr:CopD family protein [Arenimonas sp.]
MAIYLWTKTFHLLFVIAWMACVFYLPRILVNLAETRGQDAVQQRLLLMGRRLYRFGHHMFGIAFVFGLPLWLGFKLKPEWWPPVATGGWMHVKLTLVALLLAYFIVAGRWIKRAEAGTSALPSSTTLRWFNELPLLGLIPIIYLVLAKPF